MAACYQYRHDDHHGSHGQNAQADNTRAIQAKLDELILTSHAENRFLGIENLEQEDLKSLDRLVAKAAKGRRGHEPQEDSATIAAKNTVSDTRKKAASAKAPKVKRKTAQQRGAV
jgi:hypothetical protein